MLGRSWWLSVLLVAATANGADALRDTRADAQSRAEARHRAVEESARRSSDLRLRILFSRRITGVDLAAGAADPIPLSALIETARGSTDPVVLQLLLDRCRLADRPPSSCDPIDLAQRWVAADAQDVIGWIELAAVLDKSGDTRGADDAWLRAGRASSFHDPGNAIARMVWSAIPQPEGIYDRYLDLEYAIGVAAAVPQPWAADAKQGCRTEVRRPSCAVVADVAFRDADSILGMQFARLLTAQSGGPEWLRLTRRQTEEALQWARVQALPHDDVRVIGSLDAEALAKLVAQLRRLVEKGDVALARDQLRALHLTESEGSERYALDMAALMKRLHPD